MQYIIVSFIVLGIFVVTTMMLCGMAYSTDREKDDAEQLKWIHQLSEEKEVNVRVIPNWIWTEWVQVCTQLKKYPDAVNNIRIVTDNERLKRSEWNHKKQLENEVTKRNR